MENERKWSPHGSQNPLKIDKNEVQKSMRKMMDSKMENGGGGFHPAVPREPT